MIFKSEMLFFAFENCIENCRNDTFSLVLDTFCICKSMALPTQNTRIDASGIMNKRRMKVAYKH